MIQLNFAVLLKEPEPKTPISRSAFMILLQS